VSCQPSAPNQCCTGLGGVPALVVAVARSPVRDVPVTAHRAGDVDDGVVGLAVAAVPSGEELAGPVGIGVEPGDGEVGALGGGFLPCGGLVPAARARPRCSGC